MSTTLSVVLIVVVLGIILLLLLGYYLLFIRKKSPPAWKKKLLAKYRLITAQELNQKLLLMELDKLLEFAFQNRFGDKQTLGKLLKEQKRRFTREELNQIWSAHKLRNKLVHDIDYSPIPSEINYAVIVLKKFIKEEL